MAEPNGSDAPVEEPTTPEAPSSPETEPAAPSEPQPGEPQPEGDEPPKEETKPDDTPPAEEFTVGTHKFASKDELLDFAKKTYGKLGGAVGALKVLYPNIKSEEIERVMETGRLPKGEEDSSKAEGKAVAKLMEMGYDEPSAKAFVTAQKILMEEAGVVTRNSPELDPELNTFKKQALSFVKSNPDAAQYADAMDSIFQLNYSKGVILSPDEIYRRAKVMYGETPPATAPVKSEADRKKEEAIRNQAAGMPGGTPGAKPTEDKLTVGEQMLKSAHLI